jgi:hypothetical protein
VECDEMLDMATGEKRAVVMLVPVWGAKKRKTIEPLPNW